MKRVSNNTPVGFATPWGTDSGAKKRMSTVDHWIGRVRKPHALGTCVIENKPLSGFKLAGSVRSGSQDRWRVSDPRGFELEISAANLSEIMRECTIANGVILDQCVWAREGGENVLLSTENEAYQTALEVTAISNSTTSWRDVKPGNRVVLRNTLSGIYLGKMRMLENKHHYSQTPSDCLTWSSKPTFVIWDDTNERLHLIQTPKLSSRSDQTVLTPAAAEAEANQRLAQHQRRHRYELHHLVMLALADANTELKHQFELEHENKDNMDLADSRWWVQLGSMFGQLMNRMGKYYLVLYNKEQFDRNRLISQFRIVNHQLSYKTHSTQYSENFDDLDQIDQVWRMYINLTTPLGNQLRVRW